MRWFPGEADDARGATSSPGQPRGTQLDQDHTPREARRAPRARPPGSTDGSPGNHLRPTPLHEVLQALADAFLAAPTWTTDDLTAAGHDTVGVDRAFVGLAVAAALDTYPRPPADAPRQLAAVLGAEPRLQAVFDARSERRPVRVLSRTVVPVRAHVTTDRPSRLLVDTVPELARGLGLTVGHLLWLADPEGRNRRADPDGPLHNYRSTWVVRPGRTPRLIEEPMHLLKTAQRTLLDELLSTLPVHDAVHGFVPGRSVVTGAARHTGRQVVLTADLTSFFASVRSPTVFGVFRTAGFAEPVARLLTALCTHRVPVHVLSAMPPGGSPDERFALRQALTTAHLPQGAPSSPALANAALRHLDARLAGWADAGGAVYTRYADDLTFSGGDGLAGRTTAFLQGVDRIVTDQGHRLNARKTRIRRRGVRQTVTGVVVNDRTATGRHEYDQLKALLHNCVRSGPAAQNRTDDPEFRARLEGRVGWVEQVHPARGARLRARLDAIDWG